MHDINADQNDFDFVIGLICGLVIAHSSYADRWVSVMSIIACCLLVFFACRRV